MTKKKIKSTETHDILMAQINADANIHNIARREILGAYKRRKAKREVRIDRTMQWVIASIALVAGSAAVFQGASTGNSLGASMIFGWCVGVISAMLMLFVYTVATSKNYSWNRSDEDEEELFGLLIIGYLALGNTLDDLKKLDGCNLECKCAQNESAIDARWDARNIRTQAPSDVKFEDMYYNVTED